MITIYDILEVNLYDDIYIIKDKHNILIRKYKSTDIEKFTEVEEAYNILGNKKTRLQYDIQLYSDYLDSKYITDNVVNIAYLYYRNNENEEAIKLLLNIDKDHKYYFDSVILLSKIYKESDITDNRNINKDKYNDSEIILLNLHDEYKENNNLKKALILIELIDLYYLINDINKVNLYMNEINSIHLFDKKDSKYIENRIKELKKKYKAIGNINFGVTKPDDNKIRIKDFKDIVDFEINNGFTEKIKINRKLDKFRSDLKDKLEALLNTDNKNNQIKYLEEALKLIDNALKDIGEDIIALKNIKEKFEKIKL